MPRHKRVFEPGFCYHLLNRSNDRGTLFHTDDDYRAFLRTIAEACERQPLRVLAYCVMPNHFHLVIRPDEGNDVSEWMRWTMTTHSARYRKFHGTTGHLWKGRFKSFAIEEDEHLLTVLRYVERNPLRGGLVSRAADWWWSSLRWRGHANRPAFLVDGPVPLPVGDAWTAIVDSPDTEAELSALRDGVRRGRPFGSEEWVAARSNPEGDRARD